MAKGKKWMEMPEKQIGCGKKPFVKYIERKLMKKDGKNTKNILPTVNVLVVVALLNRGISFVAIVAHIC
jgi:hypothetical protein